MDYRRGDDYRRGGRRDEEVAGKVYVGDLPRDVDENELEQSFKTFGR